MKEQREKEKNEKNEKKKKSMSKEKRFYLFTAGTCATALVAIVLVAVLVANFGRNEVPTTGKLPAPDLDSTVSSSPSDDNVGDEGQDDPVIIVPEGMIMPVGTVSVSNDFGFYHNATLNQYYEHTGVDFSADVGTEVLAAEDGVVENIIKAIR